MFHDLIVDVDDVAVVFMDMSRNTCVCLRDGREITVAGTATFVALEDQVKQVALTAQDVLDAWKRDHNKGSLILGMEPAFPEANPEFAERIRQLYKDAPWQPYHDSEAQTAEERYCAFMEWVKAQGRELSAEQQETAKRHFTGRKRGQSFLLRLLYDYEENEGGKP